VKHKNVAQKKSLEISETQCNIVFITQPHGNYQKYQQIQGHQRVYIRRIFLRH
jgi:hypothetical protein